MSYTHVTGKNHILCELLCFVSKIGANADPQSFVRGGSTLFFLLMRRGRIQIPL